MSAPAFAWACEQGERLGLDPLARWLLVVLANRANGEMVTWPSQGTLERWTGLTERHIRRLTKILRDAGLVEVRKQGRSLTYHILREPKPGEKYRTNSPVSRRRKPDSQSGIRKATPDSRAGVHRTKPDSQSGIGPEIPDSQSAHTGLTVRSIPDSQSAKTTTETTNETEARVRAREASEKIREKEGAASTSHDPFNDVLDQIAAGRRRSLAAVEGGATVSGPVPDGGASVGPVATAALVAGVARAWFTNYPPRAAKRDAAEQVAAVVPLVRPLRSVCLTGEALRLARERAGIGVPAREAVAQ